MGELTYKIALAAMVVVMNGIRMYYQRRYQWTHTEVLSELASRREHWLTRVMFVALAVPGTIWLLTDWLRFGQVPLPEWLRVAGVAVGVFGMWWFWRIHRALGDNWSPVLEIRQGHTLITGGPYRWVRHPMYSDMLLWLVGFALMSANWFYALSIAGGLALMLIVRIPDEERLMKERFGEPYVLYMQRTKRLIPFVF
jgi:protein-S-isoprenylcysteine O-methyltransferase Ste14